MNVAGHAKTVFWNERNGVTRHNCLRRGEVEGRLELAREETEKLSDELKKAGITSV